MFNYWYYWKNIDFRFKLIIFIISIIILYFPLKLVYNLYFNPLYIIEKYYNTMEVATRQYETYLKYTIDYEKERLNELLNEMIEEREKIVLNPEIAKSLMKKYYIDLEKEEVMNYIIIALSSDSDHYYKNIKITQYGYEVYIANPEIARITLDSNDKIIERTIVTDGLKKIKYPENAEITFYIVRTWKGLKIDWIKSVYNYKYQDIDQK
ncbi:hypothetical protein [Marinitoga litoralis]|uniref:hypothetical protein n=1 Tax=Marinitoga litoralis TaxID=570855 RepID=UPI00196068BD|nr:hypothetical protein [Marinitoga litoralis]MBM7559009.1 hypothetical protein [Marinitoga litoralis]